MKVSEILCEALKKKKIVKPKPRPKKNLWFGDRDHWYNDLSFAHGKGIVLQHTGEENEEQRTYYATDSGNPKIVHGVWQGKQNRGITFHKPRHIAVVKHPRIQIKQSDTPPADNNNIISRPVTR